MDSPSNILPASDSDDAIPLAVVDFHDGTQPSSETDALAKLVPGSDPVLYDHTGKKTNFPTWIAIRRQRLKKAFLYDNFVREGDPVVVTDRRLPENQYYIWVSPAAGQ